LALSRVCTCVCVAHTVIGARTSCALYRPGCMQRPPPPHLHTHTHTLAHPSKDLLSLSQWCPRCGVCMLACLYTMAHRLSDGHCGPRSLSLSGSQPGGGGAGRGDANQPLLRDRHHQAAVLRVYAPVRQCAAMVKLGAVQVIQQPLVCPKRLVEPHRVIQGRHDADTRVRERQAVREQARAQQAKVRRIRNHTLVQFRITAERSHRLEPHLLARRVNLACGKQVGLRLHHPQVDRHRLSN
jgi:hypothetical protein